LPRVNGIKIKNKMNLRTKQERQPLLKAKYSPQAMPAQHFVNPDELVQAVSCTQNPM